MFKLLLSMVVGALSPAALASEIDLGYKAPSIDNCDDLGQLGVRVSSDGCVLVYGYGQLNVGYDSSAGLVWSHLARGSVGVVSQSDRGIVAGVVTVTSARDFFWGSYDPEPITIDTMAGEGTNFGGGADIGFGFTSGALRIDEAYLRLGDATSLKVGKLRTLVDFGDVRTLTGLDGTLFAAPSWSINWRQGLPQSERDYTTGLQLMSELGPVSFAVGAEDLSDGGAAVGAIRYVDGSTTADVTAAYFAAIGEGDAAWGLRAGLDSELGEGDLVADFAYDSSHYWSALVSGSVSIGAADLIGSGAANSMGQHTAGLSARLNLKDGLKLTASAEQQWRSGNGATRLLGAGIAYEPLEYFELTAEVGYLADDLPLRYLMVRGATDLPSGFGAILKGTFTDEGAYKWESSIVQRLH